MCAGAGATPTLPEGETPRYRSQQNQKATRATQWEAKAPATATEGVRIGNSQSRFPTTLALSCTQPLIEPASQKRKAAKKEKRRLPQPTSRVWPKEENIRAQFKATDKNGLKETTRSAEQVAQ